MVSRLKYHAGSEVQTFPNRGCLIDRHVPASGSCITQGNRITMAMIRVEIPFHLQNLARSGPEVLLEVSSPVTINTVLDALD